MTTDFRARTRLYSYFRSSAAFRVRIAMNIKGLDYEILPVHLLRDGGEQFSSDFKTLNPTALVPVLEDGDLNVTQSLAIIEYLDEAYPKTPLLPSDAAGRARVRSLALTIACEIHPLNNLRVLNFLTGQLEISAEGKLKWYKHWVESGLAAFEAVLVNSSHTGDFCHGQTPTLADCCLVPQVFNAQRFNCDLDRMPLLMAIYQRCMALPAFQRAHPSAQPDYEGSPQ